MKFFDFLLYKKITQIDETIVRVDPGVGMVGVAGADVRLSVVQTAVQTHDGDGYSIRERVTVWQLLVYYFAVSFYVFGLTAKGRNTRQPPLGNISASPVCSPWVKCWAWVGRCRTPEAARECPRPRTGCRPGWRRHEPCAPWRNVWQSLCTPVSLCAPEVSIS